jgi:VanZ family protein
VGTNTSAVTTTASSLWINESSFREGFCCRRVGRSSDSGCPPVSPSQPEGQWHHDAEASPLTAAGPSRIFTGVPQPLALCAAESSIDRVTRSRTLTHWLPVVAWAALIFAFSSIPHLSSGLGTWDTVLRKCAHVTEYAILALLLARALAQQVPAFALGVLYAVSDEVHQSFVRGRHAAPLDVAIDSVGLVIGLAAWHRAPSRIRGDGT